MTITDHHSASESFLKHVENEVSDQVVKESLVAMLNVMRLLCDFS